MSCIRNKGRKNYDFGIEHTRNINSELFPCGSSNGDNVFRSCSKEDVEDDWCGDPLRDFFVPQLRLMNSLERGENESEEVEMSICKWEITSVYVTKYMMIFFIEVKSWVVFETREENTTIFELKHMSFVVDVFKHSVNGNILVMLCVFAFHSLLVTWMLSIAI